ncbi:hypothetical protein G8759_13460 [Spirosoma aureum]|uniref:DUF3784 domain-containing protein n=1 Tax=Spirosoma aureum TaxID=2692134 RepID=A0A6G9AMC7_9BACT|nr:hypothetical protein [Spirosoma aureum]QIP13560.1 hypothetical protein G8759_13460 [Spirosoma aureum]
MSTIFFSIGLFIALLGMIIGRFERTDLLSNVDKAAIIDKKGLARWARNCLFVLATCAFSVGGISRLVSTERGQLIICIAFILSSQLLVVIYLAGLQRFTK